jgi:hypothetical protein
MVISRHTEDENDTGSKPQQHHEIHEARRKYPRLLLDIPVVIKKPDEEIIEAHIHDISIDGLQIHCDHLTAALLYPSGKFIKPGKEPVVQVSFSLPFVDGPCIVDATCRIFYVTGIADSKIAFGLQFITFMDNCGRYVDLFIMGFIEPVEDKVLSYLEKPRSHREISEYMHMEMHEVTEVLERLKIKGDIISHQDGDTSLNLKLSSALVAIFSKLEQLDERITCLENRPGD